MTETDPDPDPDPEVETDTDDGPTISRRGALAALVGAGMGATGAMGVAQTTEAAPSGALGASGNALEAAYLAELRGPILDQGTPIDQLVNVRVAETGTTVNADPGTLIIRYNP